MNLTLAHLQRELSREILFDEGVEAARNACVAGASIAAAAIVAAAYSDSQLIGLPALRDCMQKLESLPLDIDAWCDAFRYSLDSETQEPVFAPGFGRVTEQQAAFLLSACQRLWVHMPRTNTYSRTAYYLDHHRHVTHQCGTLNQVGLMSLVCVDQHVTVDDAERTFMVLRIESAIAEAQKARQAGLSQFPFLSEQYQYEGQWPKQQTEFISDYVQLIGLE